MSVTIKIESKLPYPKEENERREKYGDPLCEIFRPYFEELAVAYHPNDEEKEVLEAITIHCHEPKFSYKKSEEKQFYADLYRKYSEDIISFFKNIETKVSIENVRAVSNSFQEIIDMRLKQKEKFEHGIKEDYEPSTVGNNPTIVRTSKTGEEDLIVDLGRDVDPSDVLEEGMTIQQTEDGKYHVGFISKKDKKRYYVEVPKDIGEKLLRQISSLNSGTAFVSIVICLTNGELVSPFNLDSKKGIKGDEITDLGIVINNARKTYGDNYLGTFDYFGFNINGEEIRILSKCSYDRVWEDSGLGKSPNSTSVFGQKDEGNWTYRKHLRTTSLSCVLRVADSGSSKLAIGQKDPIYQACLLYDLILYALLSLCADLQLSKKSIPKLRIILDSAKKHREYLISHDMDNHLNLKPEVFDSIFNYVEKELGNYKQTSLINRLFKK